MTPKRRAAINLSLFFVYYFFHWTTKKSSVSVNDKHSNRFLVLKIYPLVSDKL